MSVLHLWPAEPQIKDDLVIASFELEDGCGERKRLWYQLPAAYQESLVEHCDPYILGMVFYAMQQPADLHVHGAASPSLLRNLAEFQAIWHTWLPGRYQPVEIKAELEQEQEPAARDAVIMAFSGGLDSAFTAWRHRSGQAGRQRENLLAGLVVHGFDIPLKNQEAFGHALERSRIMLDSLEMDTIPLATNMRSLGSEFDNAHGALLASCLSLLGNRFSVGLIATSHQYSDLFYSWAIPYGSNPISDEFLSSDAFAILNDGASHSRSDKTLVLANWPEALRYMRVCLGQNPDRRVHNCCRCEKCIRNILTFRALGLGLPPCFPYDVSNRQILRIRYTLPVRFYYYNNIIRLARQYHIRDSWVTALRLSMVINHLLKPVRESGALRRIRSLGR